MNVDLRIFMSFFKPIIASGKYGIFVLQTKMELYDEALAHFLKCFSISELV